MDCQVSIIIVNYNTVSLTKQCIRSIYYFTSNLQFEIIVVDNNSTDGSKIEISSEFPNVIFISNKENMGFGRANNLGSKIAKGKYLFFLNSDTLLHYNAISKLYTFMESNLEGKIGACGGRLINSMGSPGISYGNFPTEREIIWSLCLINFFPRYFQSQLSSAVIPNSNKDKDVDFISGADLFIRKDLFTSVGMFDSDFFMYCEDAEICYRIKKAGYRLIYKGDISIIHLESGSQDKATIYSDRRFLMIMKSRLLFFEKCYGFTSKRRVKKLLIFRAILEGLTKFKLRTCFSKVAILKTL